MEELLKKYPEFEKQIRAIYQFRNVLSKEFPEIKIPGKSTGDRKIDVPFQYRHFINVIRLRFQSQLLFFINGLEEGTPEAYSTARNCMETTGALIFVYDAVEKCIEANNFDRACEVLYKASMGERVSRTGALTREEVMDPIKRVHNVLDYIDKADKIIRKTLKVDGKEVPYFRPQYDILCEFTHPNYSALALYWGVEGDEIKYDIEINNLDFGHLVHLICPFFPIYLLFMKRALALESQLNPT